MSWFGKIKYRSKRKTEIMKKLLGKLSDTNSWTRDKLNYIYKDKNLVIRWGVSVTYVGATTYRQISEPTYMPIPFWYKKRVQKLIDKIDYRENYETDKLDFLNQYLSDDYCYNISIINEGKAIDISEATIWLTNNEIFSYCITNGNFWFKSKEDAMAFKLRWL